jgi:hypothetical protein
VRDPNHLREQARRCRALLKTATEPDVIEQLRVWSVELVDEADTFERSAGRWVSSARHTRVSRKRPGRHHG